MGTAIRITVGERSLAAELNDTPTAQAIADALPLEVAASTWGHEIYFGIGVDAPLEPDARDSVQLGDLGYWPPGQAFCIFYGRTPVSTSTEIRPASPVNVVGRVLDDPTELMGTANGTRVRVERSGTTEG
jgi:hypothetical protein